MRNEGQSPKPRRRAYRTYANVTDDFGNALLLRWCYGPCQRWLTAERFAHLEKKTGRPKGMCHECKRVYDAAYREANRERIRELDRVRLANSKEQTREVRKARYKKRMQDPAYKEKRREYCRQYMKRLQADPERHAAHLETRRMAERLRRERKVGQLPTRILPTKYPVRYGRVELDPKPMRDWVLERLEEYNGHTELGAACGVTHKQIYDLIQNSYETITLDKVDRMLTNEGSTPIQELYPQLSQIQKAA